MIRVSSRISHQGPYFCRRSEFLINHYVWEPGVGSEWTSYWDPLSRIGGDKILIDKIKLLRIRTISPSWWPSFYFRSKLKLNIRLLNGRHIHWKTSKVLERPKVQVVNIWPIKFMDNRLSVLPIIWWRSEEAQGQKSLSTY